MMNEMRLNEKKKWQRILKVIFFPFLVIGALIWLALFKREIWKGQRYYKKWNKE